MRERDVVTGQTLKVAPPIASDFQMTSARQYTLTEGADQITLSHRVSAGTHYTGPVYFNGVKLDDATDQYPLIIYGGEDSSQRLRASQVETSTYGSKMTLPNMRGRSLKDIEFDSQPVLLGQTIDVGFRTTDAVQYLFNETYNSLNAFDIGFTLTGPRAGNNAYYKGGDIGRHSTQFISQNFQGVNVLAAMSFIGRYDKHTLFYDRFSNLLYAPNIFMLTDRKLGDALGVSAVKTKPLIGNANQITVHGKKIALNDDNIINVDDMEAQKKDGSVMNKKMRDPLSRTRTKARLTAAEMLRFNRKAQTVLQSEGHMNSWDLDPGDVVYYKSPSSGIEKYVALLKVEHSLRSQGSDFIMVREDNTLEAMLSTLASTGKIESQHQDYVSQILTHDLSNIGNIQLFVKPSVSIFIYTGTSPRRYSGNASGEVWGDAAGAAGVDPAITAKYITNGVPNKHAGLIIGHRYSQGNTTDGIGTTDVSKVARGAIGVGASLSTTVSAYTHIGTTITVASTDGFPLLGALMVTSEESTKSMYLTYTGITNATTFEGVARTPTALTGNVAFSPHAKVIYARPRSHEVGTWRSIEQVVV
tara:strand:- start:149 stop:1906 length:1758 start_codon:yes stop_codon:yes gene_type:complete